jgi:nucleoside diphosphate-linked moiety X motif protein 19
VHLFRLGPSKQTNAESMPHFNYEVLMLKRSTKSKFMPSLHVFPGGMASDADFSDEWLDVFGRSRAAVDNLATLAKRGGCGPPMFSRTRDNIHSSIPSEIAFRICAIRETFEESGILLATDAGNSSLCSIKDDIDIIPSGHSELGTVCHLSQTKLSPWRKRVDKDASEFVQMCKELRLMPDVWALGEWSNWLTPVQAPVLGDTPYGRRYDTAFFICCLDHIPEAAHDDRETVASQVHAQHVTVQGNFAPQLF